MLKFIVMKYIIFLLLLIIISTPVSSQETKDATLVKLTKNLQSATDDHQKIKALLKIGDYQIEREFSRAENYFIEAKKLIEICCDDHQSELAFIYSKLGVINRRKGNYGDAITLYYKAKSIYEKLKDTSSIAEVIHNTSLLYRFQGEDRKAISSYKKSLDFSLKMKDTLGIAATYNMLGVSYRRLNIIDSALIGYEKAKHLFSLMKNEEEIRGVNNNMATLYAVQKKYDKSLPIKLDNLAYYKKIRNLASISTAYYNISVDYRSLKKYQISLKYIDSSLNIALKEGFKERISKGYLRKSGIYRKLKDFENAYKYYRYFNRYSDSIFNMQSIKKNKELELQYEFDIEKKEFEIKAEAQKSKNRIYILLLINLIILGLLIAYLMRRNYKGKIKYIATKLEKEKLSQELLNQKIKVSEAELKWLVADNKMRLTYLKEFYDTLQSDFKSEKTQNTKSYIKALILKTQMQISTEEKFSKIQDKVETVNRFFENKLIDKYPTLTKSEREVCGLLRINLSIKEVASIRNTSIDSIKSIRYRLRKKFKLDKSIELEKFIQSL